MKANDGIVVLTGISEAAILGAIDYKVTFAKSYESDEALQDAHSRCHKRSAERVLTALLANGGTDDYISELFSALSICSQEYSSRWANI